MPKRPIDRDFFYKNFPSSALGGKKMSAKRKEGFEAIFDAWDANPAIGVLAWPAYMMATAWHETGAVMLPVRESFATTDASAFNRVSAYCKKKGIANYAARHPNGNSYYGRGYVQLTHGDNYKKMGKTLGLGNKLYDDPEKVLDEKVGAEILAIGLIKGLFRPAKGTLKTYFDGTTARWTQARNLVNGDVKKNGAMVGGYGKAFLTALRTK
jgi:Chitinase class I